ncbi:uncharacterized protein [Nicotiana tomentosiformis]|uniref:uncharacterized protein n=1 Tax=Nicotiana tomentosiformis TaxID=4098 RepID=UPI00051BB3AC
MAQLSAHDLSFMFGLLDLHGMADGLGSGSPRNGDAIFLCICTRLRKSDDCGMDLCCYQRCCLCCSFMHHEASHKNEERRVHALHFILVPHSLRHYVVFLWLLQKGHLHCCK